MQGGRGWASWVVPRQSRTPHHRQGTPRRGWPLARRPPPLEVAARVQRCRAFAAMPRQFTVHVDRCSSHSALHRKISALHAAMRTSKDEMNAAAAAPGPHAPSHCHHVQWRPPPLTHPAKATTPTKPARRDSLCGRIAPARAAVSLRLRFAPPLPSASCHCSSRR